ncbi:hypothetical protein H0H93_009420, partial [Arthromyces matolae]
NKEYHAMYSRSLLTSRSDVQARDTGTLRDPPTPDHFWEVVGLVATACGTSHCVFEGQVAQIAKDSGKTLTLSTIDVHIPDAQSQGVIGSLTSGSGAKVQFQSRDEVVLIVQDVPVDFTFEDVDPVSVTPFTIPGTQQSISVFIP